MDPSIERHPFKSFMFLNIFNSIKELSHFFDSIDLSCVRDVGIIFEFEICEMCKYIEPVGMCV